MPGNAEHATPSASVLDAWGGSELASSVPAVPPARDIEVAPERILDVAAVIDEQASALQRKLAEKLAALRIPPPSQDIVSTHAIEAWNEVIAGGEDSYERRVRAYVQELRELAGQLRSAAETYRLGEDEKAAAFGDRRGFDT
jgi:uncharacterized protein YukE